MSILTELKKLTKKKNATVVSQALPDSLDGDGSGSGGGANVLTLYIGTKDKKAWAYKNQERNVEYESYDEARTAIVNASSIKLFADDNTIVFPLSANALTTTELEVVTITALSEGEPLPITLYSYDNPKRRYRQ